MHAEATAFIHIHTHPLNIVCSFVPVVDISVPDVLPAFNIPHILISHVYPAAISVPTAQHASDFIGPFAGIPLPAAPVAYS